MASAPTEPAADEPAGDELIIPAVHAVVHPIVTAARRNGPLPPVRGRQFLEAPDPVKLAVLLVLAQAWIVADGLTDGWLDRDYLGGPYHRAHLIPAVTELDRRRYPPTGDRATWVRYGPNGPPASTAV